MKTLLLCALVVSTAAFAEGSYSNAPAGADNHDLPPPTAGKRFPAPGSTPRVPVNAAPGGAVANPPGEPAPFAGVPDVSAEPPPLAGSKQGQVPAATPEEVVQQPPASQPAKPNGPLPLVDVFSVEQNPGQGYLDYTRGGATERIDFGSTPGHFVMGMVFRGEYLPDQLGEEFKQKNIFQIAFGTLRSRLQGQTPQFGALSVLADGMIEFSARYQLRMPTGQTAKPDAGGLMLFTSPQTPVEQSDEEKLKSTYFAQSGSINITPEGKARIIDIRARGRRLTYRMQPMKLEIKAKLVTPFNATEAMLNGAVQFPMYFSEDRAGDVIAKEIARESFGSVPAITVLEDPEDPSRTPASVKKKKKKSKKAKKPRRDDYDGM